MRTAGARPGGRQVALPGPCLCRRATRALGAPEVPPNLPQSHLGQPLQAWPPPCLVTDRGLVSGFPGGRGLHPPFTGNVRSSCPLWTSSQLKLMFLLKFANYPPVQVHKHTVLCVYGCGHPSSGIPYRNVPAPGSHCIGGPGDPP